MLSSRDIEALRVEDAFGHWQAAERLGLDCPLDVFGQLFHEHDVVIAGADSGIDWLRVGWSEERLSGAELRGVTVDRFFQRAVDEARSLTIEAGLTDDRPEVVAAWRQEHTWIVPRCCCGARSPAPCIAMRCSLAIRASGTCWV